MCCACFSMRRDAKRRSLTPGVQCRLRGIASTVTPTSVHPSWRLRHRSRKLVLIFGTTYSRANLSYTGPALTWIHTHTYARVMQMHPVLLQPVNIIQVGLCLLNKNDMLSKDNRVNILGVATMAHDANVYGDNEVLYFRCGRVWGDGGSC